MKRIKINHMSFGNNKTERITIYHLNRPSKYELVGFITGPLFDVKIPIKLVDDDDLAGLVLYNNGSCVIKVSRDIFYGFKSGNYAARTAVFHEIGHLVRGGYEIYSDQDKYDEDREKSFNDGHVLDIEKDADAFAVTYLGAEYVIKGLREIIDMSEPSENATESEWEDFETTKKELERRIDRIKREYNFL